MNQKTLDGYEPSWYDKEDNTAHFTTNFGTVAVIQDTWELVDCCIGIAREYKQNHMQVKIYDDEFQVLREQGMFYNGVLESPGYKYPIRKTYVGKYFDNLSIAEVLGAIQEDTNNSTAAVAVKKELVRLMMEKLKFTREDSKALKELFKSWRTPILKKDLVERKAIIVRTPIITQEVQDAI
mgnify:FL=1